MHIALIRLHPNWLVSIEQNPALKGSYKMFIGQVIPNETIVTHLNKNWDFIFHRANKLDPAKVKEELRVWFKHHVITHVVACQKLIWYSILVEEVCRELGLSLTWCEIFFDGKIILDRTGLQYTKDNDLHFESLGTPVKPALPTRTRSAQPGVMSKETIYSRYRMKDANDAVLVLGQTPFDMSLLESPFPNCTYEQWFDGLFRSNPDTKFLFKHHPGCETASVRKYPNVHDIKVNLDSAWDAFNLCASYSSTTIFEGLIRKKKFVTGGYHFGTGNGLTVEAASTDTSNIAERLKAHVIPEAALQRRLWFVCNRYTMLPNDPKFAARITKSSEEFFKQ